MPVAADLKHYKAANHPADDSSTVGGAIGVTEILGASVGEIIPSGSVIAEDVGGADKVVYYKSFLKNTHGADPLEDAVVWAPNALDQLSAASEVRIQSTDAGDGATKKARVYGLVSGAIATEDVTLNGVTPVVTTQVFDEIYRVALLLVADDSLTTAVGDIQIRRDADAVLLGLIPGSAGSGLGTGYSWATAEVDIGLAAAQNDSLTSANRLTPPAGISFSRPRTEGAALAVPGTDIAAGDAIGVWRKVTVAPGMTPPPAAGVQAILALKGVSV